MQHILSVLCVTGLDFSCCVCLSLNITPSFVWIFSFGTGYGVHFYGRHSGVICCYAADGCDDGGGDSESSIG